MKVELFVAASFLEPDFSKVLFGLFDAIFSAENHDTLVEHPSPLLTRVALEDFGLNTKLLAWNQETVNGKLARLETVIFYMVVGLLLVLRKRLDRKALFLETDVFRTGQRCSIHIHSVDDSL